MAEANGAASTKKGSQAQAVKEVLQRHGPSASPKAVAAEVKEAHGLGVRPKYVSVIKAELFGKNRAATVGEAGRGGPPPGPAGGRGRRCIWRTSWPSRGS